MSDIFEGFKYSDDMLLETVLETAAWLEEFEHTSDSGEKYWDILPGKDMDPELTLTSQTSLYGGTAGIVLFFLRLYEVTKESGWLDKAKGGGDYLITHDKGKEAYDSYGEGTLLGIPTGYLNGPAGSAYVSYLLYEATGDSRYLDHTNRLTAHLLEAQKVFEAKGYWSGQIGILSDGGLALYLLWLYERNGDKDLLEAADRLGRYIEEKSEYTGDGARWICMDSVAFGLGDKGYFPGFFYGTAGTGYILARLYEHTGRKEYLELAKKAARYIKDIADRSKTGSALVRYNDPYVPKMHYLGMCQGPIGTSRLFYILYKITGEKEYLDWVLHLTDGILDAGAPKIHSKGYWHTYSYCCGAAGMAEHFTDIYKLTGEKKYLEAARDSVDVLIGDSNLDNGKRRWYTAWNRHAPDEVECWSGLYLGSAGCASSILYFYNSIKVNADYSKYIEDPYK